VASSSRTKEVLDHEAKAKGSNATWEEMENRKGLKVSGYDGYERIGKEGSQR